MPARIGRERHETGDPGAPSSARRRLFASARLVESPSARDPCAPAARAATLRYVHLCQRSCPTGVPLAFNSCILQAAALPHLQNRVTNSLALGLFTMHTITYSYSIGCPFLGIKIRERSRAAKCVSLCCLRLCSYVELRSTYYTVYTSYEYRYALMYCSLTPPSRAYALLLCTFTYYM